MMFQNQDKDPNQLHDFLIQNDCKPIELSHNAQYSENSKVSEATEIYIKVESEKETLLNQLVQQFMAQ